MSVVSDILLLSGSLRTDSTNSALLRTAGSLMAEGFRGAMYEGMGQLPHFNPDEDDDPLPPAVRDLRRRIASAAGLLICTPEYAGALPGSFKNLLDWTVGGVEICDKPTAWINVSAKATGAANAHSSLRLVLNYTGAAIVDEACVHAPVVPSMINEDRIITDRTVRDAVAGSLAVLTKRAALS
ncbi:NADPH-dependent FMN reductase [Rhodococcus sp. ACT016]|uniref:NADPH-dependent FMN reductase n=1 Tax=Rhodococcus sp. ACT016 TaxID=3134808 RepID=UPI003D29B7F1